MPGESIDDLLEQNCQKFAERLRAGDVTPSEARSQLSLYRLHLQFLRTLLDKVEQTPEFVKHGAVIRDDIKKRETEIQLLLSYLSRPQESSK